MHGIRYMLLRRGISKHNNIRVILRYIVIIAIIQLSWLSITSEIEGGPITCSYTVRDDHPRIFITSDMLPILRHRYGISGYEAIGDNFGALQAQYEWLKTKVDGWISRNLTDFGNLPVYSFYALIENTSNSTYLNQSKITATYHLNQWLNGDAAIQEDSSTSFFGRTPSMPLFFDWTYNLLTPEERDIYAQYLVNATTAVENLSITYGTTWRWTPHSWYIAYPSSIYNEGYNDTAAHNGFNASYQIFSEIYLATLDEVCSQGYIKGYGGPSYNSIYASAEIIYTMTGQSFYESSDILQNAGTALLSRIRNDAVIADGPGKYNMGEANMKYISHLLALRNQDPVLHNISSYYASDLDRFYTSSSNRVLNILLWYDPESSDAALGTLPRAWCGNTSGILYMRDRWENYNKASVDSIHAGFFNGPSLVSGELGAQNHFQITRGSDPLIIQGANFEESDGYHWFGNWFTKTISHNGLLVVQPGENYGTMNGFTLDNDGGASSYGGNATLGQLFYPIANIEPTRGAEYRGRITRYDNNNNYTYVRGADAHIAYLEGKLTEWTRDFVYLRPDVFIVFDRVNASNSSWNKSIVLHIVNTPTLDGSETQLEGSLYGGIYESTDSTSFYADNNASRIFVHMLLPQQQIMRRVGGANEYNQSMRQNRKQFATVTYNKSHSYEWYYAGKNNAPSPDNDSEISYYTEEDRDARNNHTANPAGDWRIELQSLNQVNKEYFLYVLWPTNISTSEMIPSTLIASQEGNTTGVIINNSKVVLFAKQDNISISTINVNETGTFDFLIFGLDSSTSFDVSTSETVLTLEPGSQYSSSSEGVLSFQKTFSVTSGDDDDDNSGPGSSGDDDDDDEDQRPIIVDNSPGTAQLNKSFVFNASVTDNDGVTGVYVVFEHNLSQYNITMIASGHSSYYEAPFIFSTPGNITYTISAVDTDNTWNHSIATLTIKQNGSINDTILPNNTITLCEIKLELDTTNLLGDEVTATVIFTNQGIDPNTILTFYYRIYDDQGNLISENTENKQIDDVITIHPSYNVARLTTGTYMLSVEVFSDTDLLGAASSSVSICRETTGDIAYVWILVGISVIIVVAIVVFLARKRL